MLKKFARKKMFRAKGRKGTTTRKYKRKAGPSLRAISAKVSKLTKTIETKSGTVQISDGTEYQHNNMYIVNNTFLRTTNGTMDVENSGGQRIGDKITLSGVSFKMMLELNERYSDVTFRMMVVRSARGDTPDGSTLWQGSSGNKKLNEFNTERYSILFTKYVKVNLIYEVRKAMAVPRHQHHLPAGGSYMIRMKTSQKQAKKTCKVNILYTQCIRRVLRSSFLQRTACTPPFVVSFQ